MLLKDEFSEVRVNLFKHLEDMTRVVEFDALFQSLLPALNELAVDKNWRTRAAVVEFLPFFAQKMVLQDYRQAVILHREKDS